MAIVFIDQIKYFPQRSRRLTADTVDHIFSSESLQLKILEELYKILIGKFHNLIRSCVCRYTAGLTSNVAPTDSMVNYTLGHHHQNGAAVSAASSVSAASASMAVAAQFYHQAASAVVDPLNSCSQGAAPGAQPLPDIPRYPWMSITGNLFAY